MMINKNMHGCNASVAFQDSDGCSEGLDHEHYLSYNQYFQILEGHGFLSRDCMKDSSK